MVSAITFGSLVNWPPFDPSDPSRPYTPRLQGLLELLKLQEHEAFGSFKGLKNAEALVVGSLRGLRMRPAGEIRHRVLYLHGQGGNVAVLHRCWLYELLVDLHCEVLAIDYRGCGYSGSLWRPTEAQGVRSSSKFHEIRHVMPKVRLHPCRSLDRRLGRLRV